jgi:nitroimidazol reductase NimA-like FMN-containing flavoprotein (pyridoxamine 5'-phosphate oxidase superfamily)
MAVASFRLAASDCRALLGGAVTGYLALSQGALPLLVPVTCALDGDALVLRAGPGLMSRAPFQPGIVAFHASAPNPDGRSRWEVLVQGRAEALSGPVGLAMPPSLPLVSDTETTLLRVSVELVSGWLHGEQARPAER